MPELPDVEGFRRALMSCGGRRCVTDIEVRDNGVLRGGVTEERLRGQLKGKRLGKAWRHGKWLFVPTVDGPTLVCQRYLSLLEVGESPRVVSISSLWGSLTAYERGMLYTYSASKAALNMMMRRFALETRARGIIAVVIQPGWVMTDMGGPGAEITPDESVGGMLRVIDGLTMEDSGRFFGWDGEEVPW